MGSITIQTGAHQYNNKNLTQYSLMMGGLNVTHDVLQQYDPLVNGYYRLFMVRKPTFLTKTNPEKMNRFKHILEYGNTGVDGLGDVTLDMTDITGGYAGRSFSVPTVSKDDTTGFSVKCYEFSGSPIREILHSWINGIADIQSGYAHYNGAIATGALEYSQANHTAEFIYVVTDRTGMNVEYACQFANVMPKGYKNDQFNSTAGDHNYVETSIEFTCTKYEGVDINKKAAILLKNYQVLVNSLEFYSGITAGAGTSYDINTNQATEYNNATGKIEKQNASHFFTPVGDEKPDKQFHDGSTRKAADGTRVLKITPSFTIAGNKKGSM